MSDNTPREYTAEETRDMLLAHIHRMVDYWHKESRVTDTREKLSGLAFSILVALDGDAASLPGFVVSPAPHPTDKDYHREQGENWFPTGVDLGVLHEFFHNHGK
jgi:hypothetical protein